MDIFAILTKLFGSKSQRDIKAIKAADIDDIADVVPRNVAENIKRKLGE